MLTVYTVQVVELYEILTYNEYRLTLYRQNCNFG